jgi:hypothetical protein
MEEKEQAANEAYRVRLAEQDKAAKSKQFNDSAMKAEYMTGFKAAMK